MRCRCRSILVSNRSTFYYDNEISHTIIYFTIDLTAPSRVYKIYDARVNDSNRSKFDSGGNQEEIEFG
jgi:hypothetical protein